MPGCSPTGAGISHVSRQISPILQALRETLGAEVAGHLITVMEGLSYDVAREAMRRVFSMLSGLSEEQSIVFELLKPCRSIDDE